MNSKRSFFKKIAFFLLLTIFPIKFSQKLKNNNKFLKKKFSKIWILRSDDI
jgi:hypothetical protein